MFHTNVCVGMPACRHPGMKTLGHMIICRAAGEIYINTPASFIICRGGDMPVLQIMYEFFGTKQHILCLCMTLVEQCAYERIK